ncbi:hypothetical protein [Paenibacillus sp. HB172176]|uniref:hypothetical protein n=1 Tax=Paenibacillus sp. HB172176 TaxID=2493690 RepID=UPI00143A43F4|nr:hypothetical protein [Paenibacillus sp. HB172176]
MAATEGSTEVGLAPPEVTYYNEIKYSIGADPNVAVGELEERAGGNYRVTLTVQGGCRARALATLLVRDKELGNIHVYVRVKNADGETVKPVRGRLSAEEIKRLYKKAFSTNPLFDFVKNRTIFGSTYVYPVYKAQIIQFPNDDLSDYYGNYNNVAAFVFREVLRNAINNTDIQFSTALLSDDEE